MKIDVNMIGLQSMLVRLEALPERTADQLLDNACAAGARVIGAEWKRRAPTQGLKKTAMRRGKRAARLLRVPKHRSKGLAYVGFRKPSSRLAHLFEFGTAPRRQVTTGRRTGFMRKTPFMRPGLDASKSAVRQKMQANLKKGLAREVRRLSVGRRG